MYSGESGEEEVMGEVKPFNWHRESPGPSYSCQHLIPAADAQSDSDGDIFCKQ